MFCSVFSRDVHGMTTTETPSQDTSHHEFVDLMPNSNSLQERTHPESPKAVNPQDEKCSPQAKETMEPTIKSRLRNSCKKKLNPNPEQTETISSSVGQEPFLNGALPNLSYSISKDIIILAMEDCNLMTNLALQSSDSQSCIIPLLDTPQESQYHAAVEVPETQYAQTTVVQTTFLPFGISQEAAEVPISQTFILPPHNICKLF